MRLKPVCTSVLMALAAVADLKATIEEQVIAIFQEKCASCHKKGDEEPELSKTTDLSALRRNDDYVKAGDSAASPLLKLLNLPEGDKKRMPKSKPSKPLPALNAEEKSIIALWIDGPANVATRDFVDEGQVAKAVLADIQHLQNRAAGVRYLSLANLYNERDARGKPLHSDIFLEYYRTGVSKMLNSLSSNPKIITVEAIDPARVVLRVTLGSYGLAPELWKKLATSYPYRVNRGLQAAIDAEKILGVLPLMRADYVVFALAQPPLYHEALGIPGGQKQRAADVALETKLGIDFDKAVQNPDAVRAGFQKSGVSQGNRLIERLPRPDGGYLWKSYDFDPTRQNERGGDLFRAPLGPTNAELTKNSNLKFLHDGGEIVFSLPNGLQGYMLTDGKGLRLEEAPLNVVTDSSRKDSRIINGISCMSCHRDGIYMTNVKDEVLAATKNLKLDPEDQATIARLHDFPKLEKFFKADSEQYMRAADQCGPAGDQEPVALLYNYFRAPLSLSSLAVELADNSPDLLARLSQSANESVRATAAKFQSGTPVPRIDFEKVFPLFVAELLIGQVPPHDRLALVEFGGNIDNKIITDPDAAGVGVRLTERKKRDLRVIDAENTPMEAQTTDGGVKVTRHPPGTRPGVVPIEPPRKVIRIMPDGSTAPPEAPPPASTTSPSTAAAAPGTPTPSGRKVFKIVTPKPGEDDFNSPPVVNPSKPADTPAPVPPAPAPPPK
ncbi:MAG: hypothetical protein ACKVY0_23055 [Prosthecobacter sp.]|uniref:hypothetical protein n=1 Tax=Prosthecobacter sp. TaxID=1965333 RepID=UPI0039030E4B